MPDEVAQLSAGSGGVTPGNPGKLFLSAVRAPQPYSAFLRGVADVERKTRVSEDLGEP